MGHTSAMHVPTDHDTLRRQYATPDNLATRASIHAFQRPQFDLPARCSATCWR